MLDFLRKILKQNLLTAVLFITIALFVISAVTQYFNEKKYTLDSIQSTIQQYVYDEEKDFEQLIKNPNFIDDLKKNNSISKKDYSVALYEKDEEETILIAWSKLHFIDTNFLLNTVDTSFLINNQAGVFECINKPIQINSKGYIAIALVPIKHNFNTPENYQNPLKKYINYFNISVEKNATPIFNGKQNVLFYITQQQPNNKYFYNTSTVILRILAVIFLCILINLIAGIIKKKKGFFIGLAGLCLLIIIARSVTYLFKIPFTFSAFELFDPTIFAANLLHPSLGDLLINLLLVFWVISFIENNIEPIKTQKTKKYLYYPCIVAIVLLSFLFIDILKSLVIDSKIPFDVENFFNLNEFTAIAFLTISLIIINFIKISILLYKQIIAHKKSLSSQLIAFIVFTIMCIFIKQYNILYNPIFAISVIFCIVLFVLLLYFNQRESLLINSKKNILSFYWVLFFTATTAAIIVFFEEKLELEQRQRIAEKIYYSTINNDDFNLTESQQIEYSYALYQFGKLKINAGNYIFYRHQTTYKIGSTIENINDLSKLIYQPNDDYSVVIIKKTKYLINFITLFAYLFFSLLAMIFFLFVITKIAANKTAIGKALKESILSIDTQIKTTILLLSAASFITVGFISIYFYNQKFSASNDDKIVKVLSTINQLSSINSPDDTMLHSFISDIENKNNIIIDVYNTSGGLIEKSNKLGKRSNYVLQQMDFAAYQSIFLQHELFFRQQEENFGELYNSFYKPLLNKNGETIGCINVPDVNYKKYLKQDLSGFIATLININAFIFLLATAIAFMVTNRITSSFALIKSKMKAVNWQSKNDEIDWPRNDEIGALVKEYNLMVRKLDETAKAFAQSQKEAAWKEMAKQVAHEIKNPLTPMKLSIQYLQNKITEDAPNIKQLSATVANTLIEQINQLSNIANDFSQFANISNTKSEKIEICCILNNIIQLFSADEKVQILNDNSINEVYIFADKTHIARLFTNLIKNAIEATKESELVNITINKTIENNKIIISLKDNGTGIPVELQAKIFTVNFTTKNSGTGLGLAICKGIVENVNGNIWFDTSSGGTTFFIEFPLA